MKYSLERVIDGIAKYIDSEIYSGMNDLQEIAARVVVGRVLQNKEHIKKSLVNNGIIKTFGVIDDEGMVELEGFAKDLKNEISKKGKITISIPLFGKLTFHPNDVNTIYKNITERDLI